MQTVLWENYNQRKQYLLGTCRNSYKSTLISLFKIDESLRLSKYTLSTQNYACQSFKLISYQNQLRNLSTLPPKVDFVYYVYSIKKLEMEFITKTQPCNI